MFKSTQSKILAALAALSALVAGVSAAISALTGYVQSVPTIPDPTAGAVAVAGRGGAGGIGGSGAVPAAGSVAPPVTDLTFAKFRVGLQTWFVDSAWTGEKLFSSQGVLDSVDTSTHVSFVTQMARGSDVVRHMDDNAINCSGQSAWSARKQSSNSDQTAYGACDGSGATGVAYEYQIDMCNQTGAAFCWFSVPHLATDDYVASLAQLVKQRLQGTAILEYSNETWNDSWTGSRSQTAYVRAQGQALGLPGMNQYYQGGAFAVYRTLQVGRVFKQVLPSAKLVFAFSGNYDIAAQALLSVYKSAKWNPSNVVIDMLAVAPYMGSSPYSLASFKSAVDRFATGSGPQARAIADSVGIAVLGAYEGGGNYFGDGAVAYANDPTTGQAYTYLLDSWSKIFNGPSCLYAHASEWKSNTAWGLYSSAGTKSARATAVEQWIASH